MDSGLSIYNLFLWSNLNFLHNSKWITFPTQSCLVLYSFCVNLIHSLIVWLIVIIIIILLIWEFFTPAAADGFSLEAEWQIIIIIIIIGDGGGGGYLKEYICVQIACIR